MNGVVPGTALACADCLVKDRATCMTLSDRERSELARPGHYRRLKRGETLIASGDQNSYCCNLIEGVLKVSKFEPDGTEHVLSVIRAAGFAGELFVPVARNDVIALTDCKLCMIPREQYEKMMRRLPEFSCGILKKSREELVETRALLSTVTSPSAMRRVSRFLVAAARNGRGEPRREFELLLTRGEIASMLGLTIGSVSRQLTRLEQDGVIARKGLKKIRLADAGRLRAIARGTED